VNKEINSRMIMFDRVDRFCAQPEIVLPTGGQTLITELQTTITTLDELGGNQVTGRGERGAGVASRLQTAAELRAILRAIAKVAASLNPVQYPGVAEQFKAPQSNGFAALLNSARATVDRLVPPIRQVFVDRLGQPLLDRLPVLLTQFETNTDLKHAGRDGMVASTAALGFISQRGMAIVRELDPIVTVVLKNKPELLVAWASVSRVERRTNPTAPATTPTATPTAPAPASPSAPAAAPGH
jgi:hypothetical protein